jgi:hypothetical protein
VRHDHLSPGTFGGFSDSPSALRVDRQRLFDHYIDTGIQRTHDQVGMGEVGRGDDHPVRLGLFEHPFQAVRVSGDHIRDVQTGFGQATQMYRQSARIRLDHPD